MRLDRRRLLSILGGIVAVLAALYGTIAWHTSNRIGNEALRASYDHGPPKCDDAVVETVSDSAVTLRPVADDSSRVGRGPVWGIRWREGWGEVGSLRDNFGKGITRSFSAGEGNLKPGTAVDLTVELVRSDPLRACRLAFENVLIDAPLGAQPAWHVPGMSDTWAIFVHGKGADRTQALSTLSLYAGRGLAGSGLPCLVITYRNDRGGPQSPDGRYHYGRTEWEDLEAACKFALAQGASRFILVGFSMGGGIVLNFLERSSLAPKVRGAVLDAPVVDFGATVDLGIRLARLPFLGTPLPPLAGALGKGLASVRFGVDWDDYDFLRNANRINAPLLVFHGEEDDVVPIEGSVALYGARLNLVTLERFEGARHLESWNLGRARYESAVAGLLKSALRPPRRLGHYTPRSP